MASNGVSRHNHYKNKGNTNENLRKKRQETNVQLRKLRKDDQVLKRRNITLEDLNTSPLKEMNYQDTVGALMTLDEIVAGIKDNTDPEKQFLCTQNARKMLSRERHPPINKMIEADIVHILVDFLLWDSNSAMQFEAAWALTNIASGNSSQTNAVVDAGAVPKLITLLENPNKSVVEQAMWALGNIAGDGSSLRDYVLERGIVKPLVSLVTPESGGTFLQNLTWTISNLCRNKNPHPALPHIVQLLPTIVTLLYVPDAQVKTDVCWALSYITDGPNERIELVLHTGILQELTRLLDCTTEGTLLTPVLRVIGNIVTGTDIQTQRVIDSGVLNCFPKLLRHLKPNIQKEACWTISNITAGTQNQIQSVIDAQLVPLLIELLKKSDYKTQKEACWAITNYTSGGSVEQLVYLANNDVIEGLCAILEVPDPKTLQVCMDGLSNLLTTASKIGQLEAMCCAVEACGGVDLIEKLQVHDNESVYSMAYRLIETYFSAEDDEENEAVAEDENSQRYFQFTGEQTPQGGFRL